MKIRNFTGRTKLQLEARAYFESKDKGGCLSKNKPFSDERYLEILRESIKALNLDERIKTRLQIEEFNEDNCITTKKFVGNDKNALRKTTKDGHYVTSVCKISKIIFLEDEVIFYNYYLNLLNNIFTENAYEYFYKDISELSYTIKSNEVGTSEAKGCFRKTLKYTYYLEESESFSFKVYGETKKFEFDNQETTQLIIKKIREHMREAKQNA